jgi:hypothetical protein
VQHVEVRHAFERHRQPMKRPPRFHHRHIERLPVVADDQVRVREEIRHRREQRAFGREAREQELAQLERAEIEPSASDEKGHGPGAAAQARGFEIDEHGARRCARGHGRIQQLEPGAIGKGAVADWHRAVPSIGLVPPIDREAGPESCVNRPAAEQLAHPSRIDGGFVAAGVGFVGELPEPRLPCTRIRDSAVKWRIAGCRRLIAANDRAKPRGKVHVRQPA